MSVFSKLFLVSYNSNVALFNHERQWIIVKLLKGIGKVSVYLVDYYVYNKTAQ